MDPRLLSYYESELRHLREMGAEFAREFPKIAGRLGMENLEVADPYVERLLEGFAFLAARVQLKVDAEFPRFAQHLLERIYPHYLAPTPSMAIVQCEPDFREGALLEGVTIPRHTQMRSLLGKGEQTACSYRNAHEVTLTPLTISEAEYLPGAAAVRALGIDDKPGLRAGLRLRFKLMQDTGLEDLQLDRLTVYLRGPENAPFRLYEQINANALGLVALPAERPPKWKHALAKDTILPLGYDDEDALIPYTYRSFQGYRLLHEYFALPQRFLFVEFSALRPVFQRCGEAREVDLLVLLNNSDPQLENNISAENFALHCTPVINLLHKRADRIDLSDRFAEHHIVPDRTCPMDFEVYSVQQVTGHGTDHSKDTDFLPFYSTTDSEKYRHHTAFYTLRRDPRMLSSKQRRLGARSSYIGSEVFLSLVDASEAPYHSNLKQLSLSLLCTNRDLPLHMPLGQGNTDFTLEFGAPVASIRCVTGPTRPKPSNAEREISWRLISHLTLNYLSLIDNNQQQGAEALRELLRLYIPATDQTNRKQIEEGLRSISSRAVTRRMPIPGPIAFGRGLEITVNFEESAFEGSGVFLLSAVLERFFARYVSINHFIQTRITTETRGEIMQWPARTGLKQIL